MKVPIKGRHLKDFVSAASAASAELADIPSPHKLEGEARHARRKHKPRGNDFS